MHQAKKKYGQNFLRDLNLLKKIVNQAQIKDKNVLEIGPGLGALTQFLVHDSKKYLAYEIDTSLIDTLKPFESEKAKFIFEDFMETDLSFIEKYFNNEDIHLVGNLPYYITTPIIFKFLEIKALKTATIMVQKEVGDRMVSKQNVKSYNAFSAILQYFTKVTLEVSVNRKMFHPVPNVDSSVIRLEKIDRNLDEALEKKFIELTKIVFQHKRKTVLNNLSTGYLIEKSEIMKVLHQNGMDEFTRAESLTIEQLIELTKTWMRK